MVKFEEKEHKYTSVADGSPWVSVTTLIHSFEPYKDWDKIAARYAKKHGLTKEAVKKMWKDENEKSIRRGSGFHTEREADILSCDTINIAGKDLPVYRSQTDTTGIKLAPSQKLEEGIYPELLVYLLSARICGQADYVEIINDTINIKDYKTNKEIKKNGYVDWDGIEETLCGPLSHIPCSNYWIYALQLNTYAYIIRKNNPRLKLGTLELLHIKFGEDGQQEDIIPYQLPDLQAEVKKMIEYYKTTMK